MSTVAGSQLAAFSVDFHRSGWTLHFLGASDSAGVLSYQGVAGPGPLGPPPHVGGTQAIYFGAAPEMNGCGVVVSEPISTFRIQPSPCPSFLFSAGPPLGGSYGFTNVASPPSVEYRYVVFVSTATPLPNAQWQSVADSLPPVSTLTSLPNRIARKAFGGDRKVHWMGSVRSLSFRPTRDTSDVVPVPWSTLRWSAARP